MCFFVSFDVNLVISYRIHGNGICSGSPIDQTNGGGMIRVENSLLSCGKVRGLPAMVKFGCLFYI